VKFLYGTREITASKGALKDCTMVRWSTSYDIMYKLSGKVINLHELFFGADTCGVEC
jgi:hypothetical protein